MYTSASKTVNWVALVSLLVEYLLYPVILLNYTFTGYWPSYNVPYFEQVYNASGYPHIVQMSGVDFSYQLAPRAKIFRRDAAKVTDMDSMKHIMRYNGEFV